jgi:hypothetical protein
MCVYIYMYVYICIYIYIYINIYTGTSVNFDGDVTKVSGKVGVAPGDIINGNFEFTDSNTFVYDTQRNTPMASSCADTTRTLFNKVLICINMYIYINKYLYICIYK